MVKLLNQVNIYNKRLYFQVNDKILLSTFENIFEKHTLDHESRGPLNKTVRIRKF